MPRRSAADQAPSPLFRSRGEPPPRHLSPDEAAEWRRVVDSLPPHWFLGASFVLLEVYVTSVVAMRAWRAVMMAETEGSPRYEQAAKLYRRETAMVVKLGNQLRLGPRHDRTKLRTVSSVKPWELCGGAPAEPATPFAGFPNWPKDDGAA